ncbi:hypothetical protein BCR35DRAFT_288343 [Leucosporidium creatinivorum]|uniref:Smr domain-containing protein n=1 Tax=Leucosporidium creatinivorum TaxID=106004 RepID=A0A1Y2FZT8_9BASI|nr:hypothetical protein BCR35DRAFT_288343 [Leucosporidium creatinivorum]
MRVHPQLLPRAVVERCVQRLVELEALSVAASAKLSLPSCRRRGLTHLPLLPPFSFPIVLSPFSHPSSASLALSSRRFTTSSSFGARHSRHPYRPPIPIYTPPPKPPSLPPRNSVFWLLPAFLRPSLRHLIGLDLLDEQNQDMANAQNSNYVELRNKAIHEGDLMGKAFAASKQAYSAGDGGRAHDLSIEGKEHQRLKEQYNDQAAQWIFNENNKTQPRGSIDLHGLYVQESIEFTERAIASSRQSGLAELRVIVGKGNHSPAHVAKIKPAIEDLMQRERLTAYLDPHNSGVLVVQLQGQGGKGSREIIGDLEKDNNNDCVIM